MGVGAGRGPLGFSQMHSNRGWDYSFNYRVAAWHEAEDLCSRNVWVLPDDEAGPGVQSIATTQGSRLMIRRIEPAGDRLGRSSS
jgi:hypothetical protein